MAKVADDAISKAKSIGVSSSKQLDRISNNAVEAASNGKKFTDPTLPKGGTTKGKYETPDPNFPDPIRRQNEAADLFAKEGYDIEMLPEGSGWGITEGANPDYLIDGKAFDCFSPESGNVRNIWRTVQGKTESQARNIVLNLEGYTGTLDDLVKQFYDWPLDTLDELLVVKDSKIVRLFIK